MIRFRRLPEDIHQKIDFLADLLRKDSNIIFAYIFGGLLKKKRSPLSDVDVAVFVKSLKELDHLELFNKVTNALGTDEVDLVVLNTLPISVAGRVLQGRKVFVDKNPFLRQRYESVTLRKYFDFLIKEKAVMEKRYGIG